MGKDKRFPSLLLVTLTMFVFLITDIACVGDPVFTAKGFVYEWQNPPDGAISQLQYDKVISPQTLDSVIYTFKYNAFTNIEKTPLKDATIKIDLNNKANDDFEFVSEPDGTFLKSVMKFVGKTIKINISKPGYMPISQELQLDHDVVAIVAVLVKEKD